MPHWSSELHVHTPTWFHVDVRKTPGQRAWRSPQGVGSVARQTAGVDSASPLYRGGVEVKRLLLRRWGQTRALRHAAWLVTGLKWAVVSIRAAPGVSTTESRRPCAYDKARTRRLLPVSSPTDWPMPPPAMWRGPRVRPEPRGQRASMTSWPACRDSSRRCRDTPGSRRSGTCRPSSC